MGGGELSGVAVGAGEGSPLLEVAAVRLAEARDEGCDLAVVTTQPGSKSQENVQRLGFELLYTRAVLVRDASARDL